MKKLWLWAVLVSSIWNKIAHFKISKSDQPHFLNLVSACFIHAATMVGLSSTQPLCLVQTIKAVSKNRVRNFSPAIHAKINSHSAFLLGVSVFGFNLHTGALICLTHSLVLDDVLHDGHPSIVLLDQPQPVGLAHSSLPVDRRWTWLSWGRQGEEASEEMWNKTSLCVCVCVCVCVLFCERICVCVPVCAFPRRGAGGNVRYEIRMQHEERGGFKLN